MASVEVTGFEDLTNLLKDMTISENDEKKCMRTAMLVVAKEVENNTPVGYTGKLKKIKVKVKRDGFATVGTVSLGMFYGMFLEYGTSQGKKHVGFFDRSINTSKGPALKLLTSELLNKVK